MSSQVRLQRRFSIGEMGFNIQFGLQKSSAAQVASGSTFYGLRLPACPAFSGSRHEQQPKNFRGGNKYPAMSAMSSISTNLDRARNYVPCHLRPEQVQQT
jgi:hypothetical protein